MDAPKIKVRCSVANCAYNKKELCFADSLEVNAMGDGYADSSEGTCCTTFINDEA